MKAPSQTFDMVLNTPSVKTNGDTKTLLNKMHGLTQISCVGSSVKENYHLTYSSISIFLDGVTNIFFAYLPLRHFLSGDTLKICLIIELKLPVQSPGFHYNRNEIVRLTQSSKSGKYWKFGTSCFCYS